MKMKTMMRKKKWKETGEAKMHNHWTFNSKVYILPMSMNEAEATKCN